MYIRQSRMTAVTTAVSGSTRFGMSYLGSVCSYHIYWQSTHKYMSVSLIIRNLNNPINVPTKLHSLPPYDLSVLIKGNG